MILVVDDDQLLAETVQEALRNEGHEVLVALDGEAALRLARQRPPDLVVLDVLMPGMDGVKVL